MKTLAPSPAKACAQALPSPLLAPAIKALQSFRPRSIGEPFGGRLHEASCRNRPDREVRLAELLERMPPVAGERPHLTWPVPGFAGLRPFAAHQDTRAIDLIESAVARAHPFDPPFLAADADDERLCLDAGDGMHARHF